MTVPLTVFALSACGGGGGSTPSVLPSATPLATPAVTPAPNPTASGSSFTYSGSLTQTITLYATPVPSPYPTSTPWVTKTTTAVTQTVSVSTGQSFNSVNGLTDFTTKETDAGALQTSALTSQTYLSYAQDSARANGVDVTEIGSSSTDSNGVSLQTSIGSANGTLERLPFVYDAQWTNAAARTDTEKDPGGEAITTTYAADGSYNEQMSYPEGITSTAIEYSDGSGIYGMPLLGSTGGQTTVTVGAPSAGQIQLALNVPVGLPVTQAWTIPVWYPQTPPVLASDVYVDEGSTTLPSSCTAGAAYASANVDKIVETRNRLDTVFGEYETDTITQYASDSYGLVCEVISEELKGYYDYSGQAGAVFAFTVTGTPQIVTTVSETLALQSFKSASTSAAARATQSVSLRPALAQPSLARARMILAAAHAQDVRRFYNRVRTSTAKRQHS
jgi:hypothetical protein